VLWCWRRAAVAGDEVEDGEQLIQNTIAFGKSASIVKRYPGT
jgi:hypothetical protein